MSYEFGAYEFGAYDRPQISAGTSVDYLEYGDLITSRGVFYRVRIQISIGPDCVSATLDIWTESGWTRCADVIDAVVETQIVDTRKRLLDIAGAVLA